uniref:Uncharacterized protein n=1 Tax=Plectus sambesii TaxID=2011161 RepID=A0A914VVK0_9BILA
MRAINVNSGAHLLRVVALRGRRRLVRFNNFLVTSSRSASAAITADRAPPRALAVDASPSATLPSVGCDCEIFSAMGEPLQEDEERDRDDACDPPADSSGGGGGGGGDDGGETRLIYAVMLIVLRAADGVASFFAPSTAFVGGRTV